MAVWCDECGKEIKGKAIGVFPPIYRIKLGDFPRNYHPKCYKKEDGIDPAEALKIMCYTSDRKFEGTVYTISDIRFPEYNGRQILVALEYGKNVVSWL